MTAVVNTETGEVLDTETAERRASYICTDLDFAASSFETAMGRMREAIHKRDDIALGYRSPGDYLSDRFGGRLARLGVDLRREVVRELSEAGLSTRAIGPVVGVSKDTVHRDLAGVSSETPAPQTPEPAAGGEADDVWRCPKCNGVDSAEHDDAEDCHCGCGPETGCDEARVPASRPPVTGIDGKSYPAPAPTPSPHEIAEAVREFPDLAHYAEQGRNRDVLRLAAALRSYDDAERHTRLAALRATVAAEKRGPIQLPDATPPADRLTKVIGAYTSGNSIASGTTLDDLLAQAGHLDHLERDLAADTLTSAIDYATRLLQALSAPTALRRIK